MKSRNMEGRVDDVIETIEEKARETAVVSFEHVVEDNLGKTARRSNQCSENSRSFKENMIRRVTKMMRDNGL